MSEQSFFPIRAWAEDDRPREKLLLKGKAALSDAELLAILIGTGSQNETAVDLSKRLLAASGNNLARFAKMGLKQLQEFRGIGEAKAVTIIAALELGQRRRAESSPDTDKVTSSLSVYELMRPLIGELPHEEFWIIYLNNANKVLSKLQLSKGGITGTLVDVRLVYKQAVQCGATSIIVCHNHPSGGLTPSDADRQITRKLKAAGEHLDVKLLDHVIITEVSHFSFSDEGML
ncbi:MULTISPECIES: DNA repair protein RadC [unclassified Flavobacterium]|uniref:RadC family protein n=1 Tax=unclassified Flavobacterium TaxID=196869 RepID=UPI001F147FB0|nr:MULTISPECIES: DNA repair protein RadC [unclassified Flavobacterium]UMY66960.1 DNA repair protein RadC [Flavobacterium sp. HJ-32-4]